MSVKHAEVFEKVWRGIRRVSWRSCLPASTSCRSIYTSKLWERHSVKYDTSFAEQYPKTEENSSSPSPTFVNKNPRNPEYFGYNKQRGYSTQYKKRNFYKRLNLLMSNRHVKAYVEDQDGNILVSVSTEEFGITRHLYKSNDVTAALNIGRVIAERCLHAGLNRVSIYRTDIRKKEKYQAFRKAVAAAGVEMTEPARVIPPQTFYTGISVKKKRKGIIGMKMNNSTKRKFT